MLFFLTVEKKTEQTNILQNMIKYNTDDFCPFFNYKCCTIFISPFIHTNICTNKDGHVHIVGSVALVANFMMVLHYVHANYNT